MSSICLYSCNWNRGSFRVAAAIKGNAMGSKRLHFRHFQNPKWCAKDKIRKFGKYLNRGIWVEFLLATFCRSFKKLIKMEGIKRDGQIVKLDSGLEVIQWWLNDWQLPPATAIRCTMLHYPSRAMLSNQLSKHVGVAQQQFWCRMMSDDMVHPCPSLWDWLKNFTSWKCQVTPARFEIFESQRVRALTIAIRKMGKLCYTVWVCLTVCCCFSVLTGFFD